MKNGKYNIQIDGRIYLNDSYLSIARWSSYSLIIKQVLKLRPKKILEIGPGNNILSFILKKMEFSVKTLDFDKKLKPDYVMDITDDSLLKLKGKFDLIIASEVLEHITYDDFLTVMWKLNKISKRVILTLPHTTKNSIFFYFIVKIPLFNQFRFARKIIYKKIMHRFNGQHYFEIGKKKYSLKKIKRDITIMNWSIVECFLNYENPYHHFFILRKTQTGLKNE